MIKFIETLPQTEDELIAYFLLQKMGKLMLQNDSPYAPENDLRKRIIQELKNEYEEQLDKILKNQVKHDTTLK